MIRQERAVRTRCALIVAAATAFEQRGYAEATLSMISTGAGVSPGALHFHFENKAAVGAAVELAAVGSLRALAAAVYARRSSALQALTETSHALARALMSDVVMRAGFRLARETAYAASLDLRGEWHAHVDRLLAEAAAEDALLPGLSPHPVSALVVAVTTGLEVLAQDDGEWMSARSLAGFWRLVLPAFATPAALRGLDVAGPHI
ncbi:ScbR family autoregulator-binding transcription factor [Streptomyces sp. NPDC050856]|uniref:ScbR family autoregulator-binding transcription factor n=1 Tax=Streptomyces sp. NPDC050856 TaxID=3154939 RepID=UPI0033E825FB